MDEPDDQTSEDPAVGGTFDEDEDGELVEAARNAKIAQSKKKVVAAGIVRKTNQVSR